MSSIIINNSFKLEDNNPLDARLEPVSVPSDLNNIPMNYRYLGMTVLVEDYDGNGTPAEYWLVGGRGNKNWKRKNTHINCGEF